MAAAKRRARALADGSYMVETREGGPSVRVVAHPADFDAHEFEVLAGGLDLPRSARGGARDMAPPEELPVADEADVGHWINSGQTSGAVRDSSAVKAHHVPGKHRTLAESQEARRFTSGDDAPEMDTVYVSPEDRLRRRRTQAAALRGARVRGAADVKFRDPDEPVSL